MQITSNTTGMLAGVTGVTDKEGRDYALVVVKGTFVIGEDGETKLAEEQAELVYADVFYGEPGLSSIKYECDFAPAKPQSEVIVRGYAFAPLGRPVTELDVAVEVGSWEKWLSVVGDRKWDFGLTGMAPTQPQPFTQMPLVYERTFGGWDRTLVNEAKHTVERRNLVGCGFQTNSDLAKIAGRPLPNIEYPGERMKVWNDKPRPAGFGIVGRNWQPRLAFAGTYDKQWLDERFPFLPADFDEHYFQSAPADQQLSKLVGGESVRCTNLTPAGELTFVLPQIEMPIVFRFRDREEKASPTPDTLLLEPHKRRFLLTWRARVAVGRKFVALREVLVGKQPPPRPKRSATPRRFASLKELARWRKANRRAGAKP
jgi:hypothetical protein